MTNNRLKLISLYYLISMLVFLTGYAFYILVRGFEPIFNIELGQPVWSELPLFLKSSFASFTHVLALSFFSYALVKARPHSKIAIVIVWSLINIIFELLQLATVSQQHSLAVFSGTFDVSDIVAVLLAGIVFYGLTTLLERNNSTASPSKINFKKWHSNLGLPLAALFGIWSILACGGGGYETYSPYNPDEPIYMSYDELRAPLQINNQRQLQKSGKIYIYQNLLIVSEPNIGVHIYDNTTPATPIHKAFIKLPGNLDVAIRNGFLYADSFIDLVVIDINDLNNIYKVQRIISVFPYDPYQVIPAGERTFYQWDISKGVVIGIKQTSSNQPKPEIFI